MAKERIRQIVKWEKFSEEENMEVRKIDEQEEKIIKALIRNPRASDNEIAKTMNIPVMTVNRKRKRLEDKEILNYFTMVNMGPEGTGRFNTRHLYLIKFRLGISQEDLLRIIKKEPNVRTVFTEFIYESHIAEIEGHTGLALIIEGKDENEINYIFNSQIVPYLKKNHGEDSIIEVSTIRLGKAIRLFHNYLLPINMEKGKLKKDWSDDAIYVG
ncbi:MAG: Lrp/AsnC family transcriptional regulator [Nitrososphaerales archaeon]